MDGMGERNYADDPMTDVPIENFEAGASLPTPDAVRMTVNPPKRGYAKRLCITLAVIVAIGVIIIGIAVGVSKNNDSEVQPSSADREDKLQEVIEYLVSQGISSRDDLAKSDSPQRQAANWIANDDELTLPVPAEDSSSTSGYTYISRYILSLLYNALDGSEWTHQFGDLSKVDMCDWNTIAKADDGRQFRQGHYCSSDGLPTALFLDENNMKGSLPTEITKLTTLSFLGLDFNSLKGSFYSGFCDMKDLLFLGLGHNAFVGTLPDCLSDMTQLGWLTLSDNGFRGQVPDLSRLSALRTLFLDDNELSGDMRNTFNNMKNLTVLYIEDNKFSGAIDGDFLKDLENLSHVDISGNKFEGSFPTHLFKLPKLELLDIHNNSFAGAVPNDIAENFVMKFLSFHNNKFSGPLPASIWKLKHTRHLDASNNLFKGNIPASLGSMERLKYLFLAGNNFNRGNVPDSFARLTNLEELSLKSTNRNGTIPSFIAGMTNLKLLDLDNNSFHGKIPASLGGLTKLEFLLLNSNNGIKGKVPQSFSQLKSLRAVFLEETSLTGNLNVLCNLPTFNEPDGVKDGNEIIVADCGGENPKIQCRDGCCRICCSVGDEDCNDANEAVASLEPEWENLFRRHRYDFGSNEASFLDHNFVEN